MNAKRRRKKLLFLSIFAISMYVSVSFSQESMYFVHADGITQEVYSQNRSLYVVESSNEHFSLPNTSFQRVVAEKRSKHGTLITIESGDTKFNEKGDFTRYLQDTRLLEISTPEIKNAARRFSKSAFKIQDVLNFVYHHISNKTEGIPIVSARTVLNTRTGDCTEYTVLTVALLRALGIPAKAMVGMILVENFGDQRDVFVFHMWAEAHDGTKWILADATRPSDIHPNRYIAFTAHNLRAEMPLEYLVAISSIKNLSVKFAGKSKKK